MVSGRHDVAAVARDLGLSERTLQRRIVRKARLFVLS
jgi:ActR/RegA family two-component response regulator